MSVITITRATANDLRFVLQQQRAESNALGFVPRPRLEREIARGRILVARAATQRLGYTFIGSTRSGVLPIYQCVTEAGVRRRTVGEMFAATVVKLAEAGNCRAVQCHCRDDLDANAFWQAVGFTLHAQQPGGDGRRRLLNTYRITLDYNDYVDYDRSDGNTAVPNERCPMKPKKPTSVRLDQPAREILRSLQKEWRCAQSDVLTTLLRRAGSDQMRRAAKAPKPAKPEGWREVVKRLAPKAAGHVVKEAK
jgi:hypothetical protein